VKVHYASPYTEISTQCSMWDVDISGLPTSTQTVTDWRQEFLCSQTTAMEQSTNRAEERHYL